MIVSGVDIIEIARIRKISERYGKRFLKKIYTDGEIDYCKGRAPQLASRFAAKEAVMKALGTGVIGVRWKDIEIIRKGGSRPPEATTIMGYVDRVTLIRPYHNIAGDNTIIPNISTRKTNCRLTTCVCCAIFVHCITYLNENHKMC